MKIGHGLVLTCALWLGAGSAWAADGPASPAATTTVTMGCFSNTCAAALAAGGTADDVVAASINAQTLAGREVMGMSGPALLAQIKPGSAKFGAPNKDGQPSASFETQDGRRALLIWATVSLTAGAPSQLTAVIYGLPPDMPPVASGSPR